MPTSATPACSAGWRSERSRFPDFGRPAGLHADRVDRYGGSLGVRDAAGLSSALGMPSATFGGEFLHPTLPEMAAAHLFHVSQAPAFVDGNKRAALAAALAFLALNGHELAADPDELYEVCMAVAAGKATKADASVFFAKHVRPFDDRG